MKNPFKIILALALLVCFGFTTTHTLSKKQINVVIDAGHGGKDYGAVLGNFTEKDIVNSITKKIIALNDNRNVVIHVTRISDEFVSLHDRVESINRLQPDVVLSLHVNAGKTADASGMEIFVNKESAAYRRTSEIADALHASLRESEFTSTIKSAPFYILKNSEYPALTLEMGYITNKADMQNLTTQKGQEKIAQAIVKFVNELQ